jgi:alkaline phosphatase
MTTVTISGPPMTWEIFTKEWRLHAIRNRNEQILMRNFLIFFLIGLMISGCSNGGHNAQLSETAQKPQVTETLEEPNRAEPTPTLEPDRTPEPTINPPKNPKIILFIGDGMGSAHRLAAQYYSVGENRQLVMDSLPFKGWLNPDPFGDELPDSASAATAYATGIKTNSDVVSLDINGLQVKTILEYAQESGMGTGLVSDKFIADATTGAFAAHVPNYSMRHEIAAQLMERRVNVVFGGGENDFLPNGVQGCHPENGTRDDGHNLIEEAQEFGYTVICDGQELDDLAPETNTFVLGLFADENMSRPYSPSLADMTRKAIEILSSNPNGYFLVVEGAMIDISSHFNQTLNVLADVIELDQAVAVGMDYANRDEDMLIIVTGDHETGGMIVSLSPVGNRIEEGPFRMPNETEFYISWITAVHTSVNIPVTAIGPGAEKFTGLHENTRVFDVMFEVLGLTQPAE